MIHWYTRPKPFAFSVLATALMYLFHATSARCETEIRTKNSWQLSASVGATSFLSPHRNAPTITRYKSGFNAAIGIIQRPLQHLELGIRTELLGVPTNEKDAGATLGARGMITIYVVFPVKKTELFFGPEAGYSLLHRKVDFYNAKKVAFLGATIGATLGAQRPVSNKLKVGIVVQFSEIMGALHCTDHQCHPPRKGRNPGPALTIAARGTFKL